MISRLRPRRSLLLRHCDKKPVTRRNFRPFLSYTCALFHFPYPISPLFAALTKTAGCHPNNSHCGTPPLARPRTPFPRRYHLSLFLSYACALFCTHQKYNPFVFIRFRTLNEKHRGWKGTGGTSSHPLRENETAFMKCRLEGSRKDSSWLTACECWCDCLSAAGMGNCRLETAPWPMISAAPGVGAVLDAVKRREHSWKNN